MTIVKYSLWIIALILLSSVAYAEPNNLDFGLVFCQDQENITDYTGIQEDYIVTQGSPTLVNGRLNKQYYYDGNDGHNTSTRGFSSGTERFTIALFFNSTTNSGDNDMVSFGDGGGTYSCVRLGLIDDVNMFVGQCGVSMLWGVPNPLDNQFHSVVIVKNGTRTMDYGLYYDDGWESCDACANSNPSDLTLENSLSIGHHYDTASREFTGSEDQIRIWNRTLNNSEAEYIGNTSNFLTCNEIIAAPALPKLVINKDYNVTSADFNKTIWRSDESGWVLSSDNTPTVIFSTDKAANCSIGKQNLNYSAMTTADFNTTCLTTDTQNHSCTLPSSQQLQEGYQNLTLACFDGAAYNTTQPLNIHYESANQIPSITYFVVNPTNPAANQDLLINVTCQDSDANDTLNVSFLANVLGGVNIGGSLNVSNNVNTLVYTLDESNFVHLDYVNVSVNCTDGINTTVIQVSQIHINQYPVLQPLVNQTVANTIQSLSYQLSCADPDIDTVTYYDNSSFVTLNSATGLMTNSPTIDDVGIYKILVTCGDGFLNVSSSFVYNVSNTDPNTTIVRTYSPTYSVYDDLEGYCTATDSENLIALEYAWYLNNEENRTGNLTGQSSGVEAYIPNITQSILQNDQNWTLSCRAYDGLAFSSWVNASVARVYDFNVDNCTTSGTKALVFTIFDENIPSSYLNASFEVDINYWVLGSSLIKNYSTLMDGGSHNYSICLSPAYQEIQSNIYVKYTSAAFTQRYYLFNKTLTNQSETYNIYNHNHTGGVSDLKITTRYIDTYQYYPNVVGKLQRFYVSEGVWRTVQMDKSGDYGLLFFNIIEQTTDYRIIFYDLKNNILRTTDSLKFVCSGGICEIDYLLNPYAATPSSSSIIWNWNYSADAKDINLTWTDTLTGTNTIDFLVFKDTITGVNRICEQTQTGSAGVFYCNLSLYTGEVFFRVTEVTDDNSVPISEWINVENAGIHLLLSQAEQAFWTFGIVLTAVMFGLFSPVGAVIGAVLGLIIVLFLGLFSPLTMTFIIVAAAVGMVIGFRLRT